MSVHADLATWAKAQLVAANIVATGGVVIRKRVVWLKNDPARLIVVAPGAETLVDRQTDDNLFFRFPLYVGVITQESQQYEDATLWVVEARATIRAALLKQKPIDAAHLCEYDSQPAYPLDATFAAGYDASLQLFSYHASETITQ